MPFDPILSVLLVVVAVLALISEVRNCQLRREFGLMKTYRDYWRDRYDSQAKQWLKPEPAMRSENLFYLVESHTGDGNWKPCIDAGGQIVKYNFTEAVNIADYFVGYWHEPARVVRVIELKESMYAAKAPEVKHAE